MTSTFTDRIAGLFSGAAIKTPCLVATTANITLNGEQTIDGVACVANNRVLVKNQSDTTANGIYLVSTSGWTRDVDFDGNRDIVNGTIVYVTSGNTNSGYWRVSATDPIVVGTSAIAFIHALVQDASSISYTPSKGVLSGIAQVLSALLDKFADAGTSLGADLIGFLQSGPGGVVRTMQAKGRDVWTPPDIGNSADPRIAVAFGDSITNGLSASNTETTSYRAILSKEGGGWTHTNKGINGAQIATMLDQAIYQQTVLYGDRYFGLFGYNDMRYDGTAQEYLNRFGGGMRCAMAWLCLPETVKIRAQAGSVSYTGVWANQPNNGGALSKGTSFGGTATFTVYGRTVLIGYTRTSGATGTLQVSIDGVDKGTLSCATTYVPNGMLYCSDIELFKNLNNTAHTVVITAAGTSAIWDWAAGIGFDSLTYQAPRFLIGNCLRMQSASYPVGPPFNAGSDASVLRHNEIIAQCVEEMQIEGLNCTLVDVSSRFFPEQAGIIDPADGIHPLDAGHRVIADAFISTNAFSQLETKLRDRRQLHAARVPDVRRRAEYNLQEGGILGYTSAGKFTWSAAFKAIGVGLGYHWSLDGWFDITQPTSGNAIGYGGAPDTAFAADGIVLSNWLALYYIPPIGRIHTSVASNFAVVDWSKHFEIPSHWIFIAGQGNTSNCLRIGNGIVLAVDSAWQVGKGYTGVSRTAPTLLNSWVNFGAGYPSAGYYKTVDNRVVIEGTIKSGTIGLDAFVLPAGFTPPNNLFFPVVSNNAYGQINIGSNGHVTPSVGSNVFVDMNGIWFQL